MTNVWQKHDYTIDGKKFEMFFFFLNYYNIILLIFKWINIVSDWRSGGGCSGDQITACRRRERRTREWPWRVILLFKIYIIRSGGVCGGGDTRRRGCRRRTRRSVGRSSAQVRVRVPHSGGEGARVCPSRVRAGWRAAMYRGRTTRGRRRARAPRPCTAVQLRCRAPARGPTTLQYYVTYASYKEGPVRHPSDFK